MSERKVLNKYYPPDFDPSKIPKLKLARDRQYTVRLMAPFNMRCLFCTEYIYKGKKFNARKETVQGESYLGLAIFRFYIKCPRCVAEISFKTDPENTDYALEAGATRNFQAEKLIIEEEERLKREREEEEMNNPMKVLENRTRDSKREMEVLENLEELRDLNMRHASVDHAAILEDKGKRWMQQQQEIIRKMEEDEEAEIQAIFGRNDTDNIKRLIDDDQDDNDDEIVKPVNSNNKRPTDVLTGGTDSSSFCATQPKKLKTWERSIGGLSKKSALASLVKVRTSKTNTVTTNKDNKKENSVINKDDKVAMEDKTDGIPSSMNNQSKTELKPTINSLSLLGNYTDSDTASDSN
ncbi:splicing factor YJU2-like [Saccoglossus kowalevskii]|uniref:Splicing factor YJU2 n=1 Tax=Saccoglossus kowalevskii TaxID=10224 RepID=A0ABM0LVQ9_SACKO|nr:PREDICTED: coiled-coil domain-containing protein 94-like [Saccoglossus kowalevskii]